MNSVKAMSDDIMNICHGPHGCRVPYESTRWVIPRTETAGNPIRAPRRMPHRTRAGTDWAYCLNGLWPRTNPSNSTKLKLHLKSTVGFWQPRTVQFITLSVHLCLAACKKHAATICVLYWHRTQDFSERELSGHAYSWGVTSSTEQSFIFSKI